MYVTLPFASMMLCPQSIIWKGYVFIFAWNAFTWCSVLDIVVVWEINWHDLWSVEQNCHIVKGSVYCYAFPYPMITRMIASYFHVAPLDHKKKRLIDHYQSTSDHRVLPLEVSFDFTPSGPWHLWGLCRVAGWSYKPCIIRVTDIVALNGSRVGSLMPLRLPPKFSWATKVLYGVFDLRW